MHKVDLTSVKKMIKNFDFRKIPTRNKKKTHAVNHNYVNCFIHHRHQNIFSAIVSAQFANLIAQWKNTKTIFDISMTSFERVKKQWSFEDFMRND